MSTINGLIREAIKRYPNARSAELARLIADEQEQVIELLIPLLLERIRDVQRADAAAARNAWADTITQVLPDSKNAGDTDFLPAVGDQPPGDGNQRADTDSTCAVSGSDFAAPEPPRRSWKHSAHPFSRSAFTTMCEETVRVNGEDKPQGRCTKADLLVMIEVRKSQVRGVENQIRHLELLVELLDEYGVEHVAEIPESAYPEEVSV